MPRRFPRKVRPREKNVPKGYDSKWEYTLHQTLLKSWNHHTDKVPYIVEHKYEPDFIKDKILIEAKGRFWDHAEYSKYIWIRKSLPATMELIFLFQKLMPLCQELRKEKTVLKELTLNGQKQIILNGIVKKLYQRSLNND